MTIKQKRATTSIKEHDDSIERLSGIIEQQQRLLAEHEDRLDGVARTLTYVKEIIDSFILVNKATRIIMRDLSERVGLTNEALEELNKLPIDDDEEEKEEGEEEVEKEKEAK